MIHRFFSGRAKRLWRMNLLLFRKGLPVPEPLTFSEASLKRRNAFFVSSVINNAESLSAYFRKGIVSGNRALTRKIAETIARWHCSGAVHGDLKWPNILIQHNSGTYECFFIDLDQSRLHASPSLKGIRKDLERFYRFGLQLGGAEWVETEFFPEYISCLTETMRAGTDLTAIAKSAMKEWIKKGRQKFS
jgi:tRNA A-37 threonylcarbamoyl transferase component Bud32